MAESKASKTDALIKAVLVFFISLLSFSIGTFVGKKFSDNQYKTAKLNGSHEEGTEREIASVHSNDGENKSEGMVNDEQVAKAAEEFVNDNEGSKANHSTTDTEHSSSTTEYSNLNTLKNSSTKHDELKGPEQTGHTDSSLNHHGEEASIEAPNKRTVAATPTEHAKPEHGKIDKEVSLATASLAADKNPQQEDKAKNHISQATTLPSQVAKSPIGKLTVQVASFPSEEEAKKKVSEIRAFGFDSFFTPVTLNGKHWYRVNVGMFPSVAEGEKIIAELKEKQIKTGFIQKMAQ